MGLIEGLKLRSRTVFVRDDVMSDGVGATKRLLDASHASVELHSGDAAAALWASELDALILVAHGCIVHGLPPRTARTARELEELTKIQARPLEGWRPRWIPPCTARTTRRSICCSGANQSACSCWSQSTRCMSPPRAHARPQTLHGASTRGRRRGARLPSRRTFAAAEVRARRIWKLNPLRE